MKARYVRVGDELTDDVTVVVRGGPLNADVLRADALRDHGIYGTYGLSVFALRDATLDELAQQTPLIRLAELTLMTVGALGAIGVRLKPTGRNARHYDLAFDNLEDGIAGLVQVEHRTVPNPYYED